MPSPSLKFCTLTELKKKQKITRWVEDWRDEISAIFLDGVVTVLSSVCPHFGGEFDVDFLNGELQCKWHAWRFDIESGKCRTYKLKTQLRHYLFAESDGNLVIKAQ